MNPSAWHVPVNAHPSAVRFRSVGETRAVEPDEASLLLPVLRWPESAHYDGIPVHLTWPNHFHVPLSAAHHYTALGFPA